MVTIWRLLRLMGRTLFRWPWTPFKSSQVRSYTSTWNSASLNDIAGQRYSFILHANQKVDNYWIRALPNAITAEMKLAKGFQDGINSAILRYRGARAVDPKTTQQKKVNLLSEAKLRPLLKDPRAPGRPVPGGADVNINLVMSMNSQGFTVNGKNFHEPSVPLLLQLMSGAKTAQELLPDGPLYILPRNKVIELTMPAGVVGGPVSALSV